MRAVTNGAVPQAEHYEVISTEQILVRSTLRKNISARRKVRDTELLRNHNSGSRAWRHLTRIRHDLDFAPINSDKKRRM